MIGDSRRFLDPEYETEITVREVPYEREEGGVSRRAKAWVFENEDGAFLCRFLAHRTADLSEPTEQELEGIFLYALRNGE
jgi:hypothetical protein